MKRTLILILTLGLGAALAQDADYPGWMKAAGGNIETHYGLNRDTRSDDRFESVLTVNEHYIVKANGITVHFPVSFQHFR